MQFIKYFFICPIISRGVSVIAFHYRKILVIVIIF